MLWRRCRFVVFQYMLLRVRETPTFGEPGKAGPGGQPLASLIVQGDTFSILKQVSGTSGTSAERCLRRSIPAATQSAPDSQPPPATANRTRAHRDRGRPPPLSSLYRSNGKLPYYKYIYIYIERERETISATQSRAITPINTWDNQSNHGDQANSWVESPGTCVGTGTLWPGLAGTRARSPLASSHNTAQT